MVAAKAPPSVQAAPWCVVDSASKGRRRWVRAPRDCRRHTSARRALVAGRV